MKIGWKIDEEDGVNDQHAGVDSEEGVNEAITNTHSNSDLYPSSITVKNLVSETKRLPLNNRNEDSNNLSLNLKTAF